MKVFQGITARVVRGLAQHAAVAAPKDRADWAQAMINELDYLSPGMPAVGWALGCLFVSYSERMRLMIRSLKSLPPWFLALEMLVCFAPLTLVFLSVVFTSLHGGFAPQSALLYSSGTVLGPLGLAAAFRSIFLRSGHMKRATMAGLCLLAAWTLTAYSAQVLTFGQSHLSDWWREFVLIAVLPVLAVIHLVSVKTPRQDPLIAA